MHSLVPFSQIFCQKKIANVKGWRMQRDNNTWREPFVQVSKTNLNWKIWSFKAIYHIKTCEEIKAMYIYCDMPSPPLKSSKFTKNSCAKSIFLKQCKFHLNEKHLIYSAAISIKFNLSNILNIWIVSLKNYFGCIFVKIIYFFSQGNK